MGTLALLQAGWEAAGHGRAASEWLALVGRAGAWLLLALFLAAVAHAVLRRGRYRAVGVLTQEDLAVVRAAVADVERRTVGEVLPVVLERSDRHPAASWLAALFTLLLGSALLAGLLPWERPALVLLLQVALGAAGYATARLLPGFQRLFLSRERAAEMAEEQAVQEFHRHGLHETEGRTGVLILVSLLERRVVVLADRGIASAGDPDTWRRVDEAVLAGIRAGSLRDGLVAGVRAAGEVLARHAPPVAGDRDEIPNRVVVRAE